jgi:hypothetical protein
MRTAVCLLSALAFASVCAPAAAVAQQRRADEISKLKQLYDAKRYFELREAVARYRGKPDARLLFFRGLLANVFNRPESSAALLNRYVARAGGDDALLPDAYAALADDYAKTFDYAKAAAAYRALLDRFRGKLRPDEIGGYENVLALYGALRETPRQTVTVGADTVLGEPAAEYGWSVIVEANHARVALGLDTGADISLLARSVAEKLGAKILDSSITFGSITSISVRTTLGVIPEMKVGSVVVRNAVFIVMDDQSLTFPDGSTITGVVGSPVIAGLRRITFNSDGSISVPRKLPAGGEPNMCLDGNKILFRGEYEQRELTFVLDTGAQRSLLYLPFLQAFEDEVKAKYALRPESFTGIGGTEEVPAYIVKDFAVRFSGRRGRLPEIRLLTKALSDNGKYFYGNVGQDLIKRFRRLTLDFDSMYITFQ